jgi:hypothetical protein
MRPLGGDADRRSSVPQPDMDQAPFGDLIQDNTGVKFRIVLWNPGGFPVNRQSGKSKVIEEAIRELDADVICLTETDVNWNKVNVYNRLHERFLGWWQRLSLNIAHYATLPPKRVLSTTVHQYGGERWCSKGYLIWTRPNGTGTMGLDSIPRQRWQCIEGGHSVSM